MNDDEWQEYDKEKKYKITKNFVLVLRPKENANSTPLFCPICDFPMKSSDDFFSFTAMKCCNKCEIYLANKNREKWFLGERPNKEEIEEYKKFRKNTFKINLNLK